MSHKPHSTDNGDSHTRRGSLTTHLTTKRHFSQRHPTTPSGTRDQQAVLHTPFGGTCAFGEALWKTRRRVIVPFPSDGTRLPSTTKTSPQSTSVTSSPQQPRVMTLPCLLPSFKQTDRPVPRRVIDRVVPCCLENQYARGGCPNKSDEDKVGTTLGAPQHGVRGVKAVLRGQDGVHPGARARHQDGSKQRRMGVFGRIVTNAFSPWKDYATRNASGARMKQVSSNAHVVAC